MQANLPRPPAFRQREHGVSAHRAPSPASALPLSLRVGADSTMTAASSASRVRQDPEGKCTAACPLLFFPCFSLSFPLVFIFLRMFLSFMASKKYKPTPFSTFLNRTSGPRLALACPYEFARLPMLTAHRLRVVFLLLLFVAAGAPGCSWCAAGVDRTRISFDLCFRVLLLCDRSRAVPLALAALVDAHCSARTRSSVSGG